jgi:TetR/AcrR family transcriptional regulator, cholesterol catabolism regulator
MTRAVKSDTRTVATRPLRADAAATRQRIIDAAVALARSRSIEDLTMRDIAGRADVSAATAYTYFASKAHVYAEAYLDGLELLTERLRARPPRGATAADRVASVFRRAVEGAATTGDVVQATAIALASSDPAVAPLRPFVDEAFDEWMTTALDGARIADRGTTLKVLQLTMFAAFVALAHGRLTLDEVRRALDLAVRRMVIEATDVPT